MVEADTKADDRVDTEPDTKVDHARSLPVHKLVAEIAAYDEQLATEVITLHHQLDTTKVELDAKTEEAETLTTRLKRAHADFQNYKKRARLREEEIRERATEDLVERLLDIRDNLVRALEQDDDVNIREGIDVTLSSFDRILEDENVDAIEPDPGDDVDPECHEVMMQVDGDQPTGQIEEVYRPGYTLAGTILRPAQVTVSKEPDDLDE